VSSLDRLSWQVLLQHLLYGLHEALDRTMQALHVIELKAAGRNHLKKFLLLCIVLGAYGCGGSGGSSSSPYSGTFIGTFTTSSSQNGTADITIGSTGAMAGTLHNITSDSDGAITGQIDGAGNAGGSYQYAGQPSVAFSGV